MYIGLAKNLLQNACPRDDAIPSCRGIFYAHPLRLPESAETPLALLQGEGEQMLNLFNSVAPPRNIVGGKKRVFYDEWV